MKNPKHTPGPWTFDAGQLEINGEFEGKECTIAEVFCDTEIGGREVAEADGRLLAAAPLMLRTLRRIEKWKFNLNGDCVKDAQELARKAIKAATEGTKS